MSDKKEGMDSFPQSKAPDVLEDIKKIDRAIRAKTLANTLAVLKEKAHEILTLKEQTASLLEAVGVSEEDRKRIIDFVNSLDDVQLSLTEKREIKDRAREEISETKKKAEKKVNESPAIMSGFVSVPSYTTTTSGSYNGLGGIQQNTLGNTAGYTSNLGTISYSVGAANMVNLSSGGSNFSMKL